MLNNFFGNVEADYPIAEVIMALREHQENHINTYLVAWKEYKRQFGERLHAALADFEDGQKVKIEAGLGLRVPENKTTEYQNLISVFSEMKGDNIRLTMQQANCIFNDEWEWIRYAKFVNTSYSDAAIGGAWNPDV